MTWTAQRPASESDITLTDVAVILATTDGGRNWERVAVNRPGLLRGLAVADATHAWAVGTDIFTNSGG